MAAITILTVLLLMPVMSVTGLFGLELLLGLRGIRARGTAGDYSSIVVIPAHDEAKLIGQTVQALVAETGATRRVLVVADNCTDETAKEATLAGADVFVRTNPALRGKGYALAAARDHLSSSPPDAVIIIDADTRVDPQSLTELASAAVRTMRPVQAVNLITPDRHAPSLVQISSFAFMIKNLIRQRGLQRLAGRAHLTGTGMAFPWRLFEQSSLGGSNIVEDLVVGLELAERGSPPLLVERARVWSDAAPKGETLVQRSRWEGGYMATALRVAPLLFLQSLRRLDAAGMLAALDLSIPPLALLVILNGVFFMLALAAFAAGGAMWPAMVQIAVGMLALFALVIAWHKEGRPFASGATLLRLPFYVLWKLPMYLRFARRGAPKEWVRTAR